MHRVAPTVRLMSGALLCPRSVAANMASSASFAISRTLWFGSSPLNGSGSPLKVVSFLRKHGTMLGKLQPHLHAHCGSTNLTSAGFLAMPRLNSEGPLPHKNLMRRSACTHTLWPTAQAAVDLRCVAAPQLQQLGQCRASADLHLHHR